MKLNKFLFLSLSSIVVFKSFRREDDFPIIIFRCKFKDLSFTSMNVFPLFFVGPQKLIPTKDQSLLFCCERLWISINVCGTQMKALQTTAYFPPSLFYPTKNYNKINIFARALCVISFMATHSYCYCSFRWKWIHCMKWWKLGAFRLNVCVRGIKLPALATSSYECVRLLYAWLGIWCIMSD